MDPFRILHDRLLAQEISKASWCPKMDLLALVTGETMLAVHRLSWQSVFLPAGATAPSRAGVGYEPDTSPVTSMAWRPDGHVLACGCEDGTVTLRLVEGGETLSRRHGSACVTAVQWTQLTSEEAEESTHVSPLDRLLLPLVPLVHDSMPVPTAQLSAAAAALRVAENPPHTLDVLASADSAGSITLSAFGVFQLGSISLARTGLPLSSPAVLELCLSPDLLTLAMLVRGKRVEMSSPSAQRRPGGAVSPLALQGEECRPSQDEIWLAILDTSILHAKQTELRDLATHAATLQSLLAYVSDVFDALKDQWHEGRGVFDSKIKVFRQLLVDYGELDRSPRAEFVALLCSGMAGPALTQFVEQTLGARGLARLKRQVLSTYQQCETLCGDLLGRAADRVLYVANVLHALAQWRDRYAAIGLVADHTSRLADASKLLVVRVSQVFGQIVAARRQFEAFFVWMEAVRCKMSEEPEEKSSVSNAAVAEFFGPNGAFEHELTGSQFVDSPLPDIPIDGLMHHLSLCQVVSQLNDSANTALGAPSDKMAGTFGKVAALPLLGVHDSGCVARFFVGSRRVVAFAAGRDVWFVEDACVERHDSDEDSVLQSPSLWPIGRIRASLRSAVLTIDGVPLDMGFTADGQLAVLERRGDDTALSLYCVPDGFEPIPGDLGVSRVPAGSWCASTEGHPERSRVLPTGPLSLAVGMKGTACVVLGPPPRRVLVFDLEENEEEEEEEEDDDEEM